MDSEEESAEDDEDDEEEEVQKYDPKDFEDLDVKYEFYFQTFT